MNKVDWDKLDSRERDEICARKIMGKTERDGNGWWAKSSSLQMRGTPHFTTDRNACAWVLDEAMKKGLFRQLLMLFATEQGLLKVPDTTAEPEATLEMIGIEIGMTYALRADPNLCCYCAVKAVETTT